MSQENVEIVRSCYGGPDLSRFFELLDDEVELDFTAYPVPDSAVMRGRPPRSTGLAVGSVPGTIRRWSLQRSSTPGIEWSSYITSEAEGAEAGCRLTAGGPSSSRSEPGRW
jgi:hypothetical protein